MGHQQFARLRVGIGEPPEQWDPADYVLSKFGKDEAKVMAEAVCRAADAAVVWATDGIDQSMNQFN
jgi:PTH1 family peptidyl-tRNA hydrolase